LDRDFVNACAVVQLENDVHISGETKNGMNTIEVWLSLVADVEL
jgi:hypothetical protein